MGQSFIESPKHTVIHSSTQSLIHSFIHSFTYLLTYLFTYLSSYIFTLYPLYIHLKSTHPSYTPPPHTLTCCYQPCCRSLPHGVCISPHISPPYIHLISTSYPPTLLCWYHPPAVLSFVAPWSVYLPSVGGFTATTRIHVTCHVLGTNTPQPPSTLTPLNPLHLTPYPSASLPSNHFLIPLNPPLTPPPLLLLFVTAMVCMIVGIVAIVNVKATNTTPSGT